MGRVIIIDDEPGLLRTIARLLERKGLQVTCGTSFEEVERSLQPGRFDVLISDIVMPGKDGLDVLEEVVHVRGCQEPVILITGQPSLDSATSAVRGGAFDYISKPVTKDQLYGVVDRAERHVKLLRERDAAQRKELDILRSLALLGEQSSLLSHEVRAPITALRQALRAVAGKIGIEDMVLVEELIGQIEQIERLLGQTLSFARPLDLKLEEVSLPEVIERAIAQVRAVPKVSTMTIEVRHGEDVPPLALDRQRMMEVLVNLLRNAAEACGGQGHIEVTFELEGKHIAVEVADDGPGVDPDKRDEIFLPFRSFKDGGTGIGLAFCRKIVEAHGGSIELVARPGLGACFRIQLNSRPAALLSP